jgi:hypothetical protein
MRSRRSFVVGLVSSAMALCVLVVPVLAAELLGTIKSVDADNNQFVVTSQAGKDVKVTVNASTVYENPNGKVSKKLPLIRLNQGGPIKVIHENGTALRLILKKGSLKQKDAR